ncbi:MAG: BolA family protein [Pseudomonadota bacterium]
MSDTSSKPLTGPALEAAPAAAVVAQIRLKLTEAFSPEILEIEDESHKHAGHGGWRPGGATHFQIRIVSRAFSGVGRVQRQRAVMRVLKEELAARVHALGLAVEAPPAR